MHTLPLPEVTEEQEQFLHTVVPPALAAEKALSLPRAFTIATIAQSIAESATKAGWGKSILFIQANNPFGIKYAHRQGQDYGHFDAQTWEIEQGRKVEMIAEFQRFPNLREAFMAHAALLARPRYRPAMDAARGEEAQSLEFKVRQCADRLGPRVPACPLDGIPVETAIPTPEAQKQQAEREEEGEPRCPTCGRLLSPAYDLVHCGYCTNPNYGHLLWGLVQEAGLLDPATLEKYGG